MPLSMKLFCFSLSNGISPMCVLSHDDSTVHVTIRFDIENVTETGPEFAQDLSDCTLINFFAVFPADVGGNTSCRSREMRREQSGEKDQQGGGEPTYHSALLRKRSLQIQRDIRDQRMQCSHKLPYCRGAMGGMPVV